MKRCSWVNEKNHLYVKYHDEEWGVPCYDDRHLFEMLLLESFQAGLSWETILNKREDFKIAFDDFEIEKILRYDEEKFEELMNNEKIVRNKLKINAAINNAGPKGIGHPSDFFSLIPRKISLHKNIPSNSKTIEQITKAYVFSSHPDS